MRAPEINDGADEEERERRAVDPFAGTLASAYQPPEPLTRDGTLAIVRALLEDDRLDSRETEALEALLAASDPERLPRLLAPGEEIPPGCTASLRAAIVSGPAAPSAEASGAYTRAQFAAAVDEAHSALHVATHDMARDPWKHIARAHEALHSVGAGLERVDCGTADPEAQRMLADLLEAGQREIPCGHKVEDLIYGVSEIGRPPVTKCGACLAALPKREPAPSRAFSPHGRTSAEIEVAAGVAARELCAEHEPGAGAVVDVRLVRRGEQAPRPVQGRWDGQRVVFDETPEVRAARERRDALREKFNSYDGGDRPMSPPVRLIRELDEAEAELRRLRGGA